MSNLYGKQVLIYHSIPDPAQAPQKKYDGSTYQPSKRVILGQGICVGLGIDYEELGYDGQRYCGQYTVMVVIREGKFETYPLHALQEVN